MGLRTLSVTEVSMYVTNVFEAEEMLHDIQVRGEISTCQIKNGIMYYTLKDANCIINCITFGAEKYTNLKIGDDVVATGTIKYYGKGGRLNFNVYNIVPYGLGDIYKKFLLLKEKLEKEGLFDSSHKKSLPSSITKIGVVSSSTGAVIQDIINVANRRNPAINIILYPAKVQGEGADITIIKGIEYFEKTDVDVVIVARGGGSYEDLQAFNSEALARAVYRAEKVIVSAVGHETDYTIIDFASDLRAPTPSAAAELVTKDSSVLRQNIDDLKGDLIYLYDRFLQSKELEVSDNKLNIFDSYKDFVEECKNPVKSLAFNLGVYKTKIFEPKENKLILYLNTLDALNPAKLMLNGYSKVFKSGKLIKTKQDLKINDEVTISFADGVVKSKITDIEV